MKELLHYIVTNIVDHPGSIEIEEINNPDGSIQFTIKAQQEDIGKIIGKEGKIIQAIRQIVRVLAIKENKQVRIEIG